MAVTLQAPGFRSVLLRDGLHAALAYLNGRVDYRYTGIYCFDGPTLRNVCLYDREAADERGGGEAPLRETWCGITGAAGDCLQVPDGRSDPRFPWMRGNAVVSYCGVPLLDPRGDPVGTLCHFDVQARRLPPAELRTLRAAAALLWTYCLRP